MTSDPSGPAAPKTPRKYRWPWVVLAFFLAGIALAVLWMSKEIQRQKHIHDANKAYHL